MIAHAQSPSLIVVGTSLGGLDALRTLLAGLPRDFSIPLVIVQHRGSAQDALLCQLLQERSALAVSEPEDNEAIVAGQVYLAPAGYHLLVEPRRFSLSIDPPVNYARPSVDVLFESAAEAYGSSVLALVLTGANQDGVSGSRKIKALGGRVVVQDPATAYSAAMPQGVVTAIKVDRILSIEDIASFLVNLTLGEGG